MNNPEQAHKVALIPALFVSVLNETSMDAPLVEKTALDSTGLGAGDNTPRILTDALVNALA